MTITIEYETEIPLLISYRPLIEAVVEAAMEYEACPYEAEITVLLTDNEAIRQINFEQRKIDAPTDVLSFPMQEYPAPSDFSEIEEQIDAFHPETGELLLGDIVISVEKVLEQASKYGHSKERELGFLVAHSMLHLFGYDHMEEDEAKRMEKKQEEILQGLGLVR